MTDFNNDKDRNELARSILHDRFKNMENHFANQIIGSEENRRTKKINDLLEEAETRRLRILKASGLITPVDATTALGDVFSRLSSPDEPFRQLELDQASILKQTEIYQAVQNSCSGPVTVEITDKQHQATIRLLVENNQLLTLVESNTKHLESVERSLKKSWKVITVLIAWALITFIVPTIIALVSVQHADTKADRSYNLDLRMSKKTGN